MHMTQKYPNIHPPGIDGGDSQEPLVMILFSNNYHQHLAIVCGTIKVLQYSVFILLCLLSDCYVNSNQFCEIIY